MCDANQNAATAAAMEKELENQRLKYETISDNYSTLQHENVALKKKLEQKGIMIAVVLGLLSELVLLAMMNIIAQALMCIVIACVAGLLISMHTTVAMRHTHGSVLDIIIMSTIAFVCVIATSAFGVLLPFLGSCAFGGCVAYTTYMFMTI